MRSNLIDQIVNEMSASQTEHETNSSINAYHSINVFNVHLLVIIGLFSLLSIGLLTTVYLVFSQPPESLSTVETTVPLLSQSSNLKAFQKLENLDLTLKDSIEKKIQNSTLPSSTKASRLEETESFSPNRNVDQLAQYNTRPTSSISALIERVDVSQYSHKLEMHISLNKYVQYKIQKNPSGYDILFDNVSLKNKSLEQWILTHKTQPYSTDYLNGSFRVRIDKDYDLSNAQLITAKSGLMTYLFEFDYPEGLDKKEKLQALSQQVKTSPHVIANTSRPSQTKATSNPVRSYKPSTSDTQKQERHVTEAKPTVIEPVKIAAYLTEAEEPKSKTLTPSIVPNQSSSDTYTAKPHRVSSSMPMSVSMKHVSQFEVLQNRFHDKTLTEKDVTPLLQFYIERQSAHKVFDVIAYATHHFGARGHWHTLGARAALVLNQPQRAKYWLNLPPKADQTVDYFALAALTQQKLGHYQEAVKSYGYLLSLQPRESKWLLGLAQSQALSGDIKAAKQSYESLLKAPLPSQTKQLVYSRIASLSQ